MCCTVFGTCNSRAGLWVRGFGGDQQAPGRAAFMDGDGVVLVVSKSHQQKKKQHTEKSPGQGEKTGSDGKEGKPQNWFWLAQEGGSAGI